MRLGKIILICICIIISLSCVKNEYIIDDYRGEGNIDWNSPWYPVFFSPRIESSYTRSQDIPFPSKSIAQLFAFVNVSSNTYVNANIYHCNTPGVFSSSSPMLIPYGNYNFYGISLLNGTQPLNFINNVASDLKNGEDYVWGSIKDQDIQSPSTTLPITFYHQAIQLQFTINNISSVKISKLYDTSKIGVPASSSSATWNLLTGEISQITSTSYTSATGDALTINDLTVRTICIPFTSSINNTVDINCLNTNNDALSFSLNVPIPTDGYIGGSSYNYNIAYAVDTVYLEEVQVLPWKEVVESNVTIN